MGSWNGGYDKVEIGYLRIYSRFRIDNCKGIIG